MEQPSYESGYALAPTGGAAVAKLDPEQAMKVGEILAKSGFFSDAREASKAAAKILLGQELGLGPVSAMKEIFVFESREGVRFALSAVAQAALVRKSGRYDYEVEERTPERARIAFYRLDWVFPMGGAPSQRRTALGVMEFTREDAIRAQLMGKPNYRAHPAAMLYARCVSAGVRTFCPDVLMGSLYAEGELDGDTRLPTPVEEVRASKAPVKLEPVAPLRLEVIQGGTVAETIPSARDVAEHVLARSEPEPGEAREVVATSTVVMSTVPEPLAAPVETTSASVTSAAEESLDRTAAALGIEPGSSPLAPDGPANEEERVLGALIPLVRGRSLIKRILALKDEEVLAKDDAKTVNAYLKELLGSSGATTAWKAVLGEAPKAGVQVKRGQVVALARHLDPDPKS